MTTPKSRVLAILCLGVVTCCLTARARRADQREPRSVVGEGTGPGAVVVADVAHAASSDRSTVLDEGPTGFSRLSSALQRRGAAVRVNREKLGPETLAEVDVALITTVAPDKPFSNEEQRALKEFVEAGGVLLLTTNDLSQEGLDAWIGLAARFGIQSHGSVLRIVGGGSRPGSHVSRYSGAGLVRWLPTVDDAPLYFQGTSAGPAGGDVLIRYNANSLAARRRMGKGWVYAFGGGDMIGNAFVAIDETNKQQESGPAVVNDRLIDALADELLAVADGDRP
jgi:hypothetical protein